MGDPNPSGWVMKLLKWFCPEELYEGIVGDLLEQFDEEVKTLGLRNARRRFTSNVFRFMHPAILIRNKMKQLNYLSMGMYKSHFRVAYRSMMKHKFYSFINIFGLAMAVAFVFLSFLFINQELQYDEFHTNKSIYRLYNQIRATEDQKLLSDASAIISIPLIPDLARQVPSITSHSRLASNSGTVSLGDTPYEETLHFVDNDFLSMFSFPIVHGLSNVLKDPNSVVISTEHAIKYFGETDVIGKSIEITLNDSTKTYFVTGVVENKERESSIAFDILVPFETFRMVTSERSMTTYNTASIEGYIVFENPDVTRGISPILSSAIEKETSDDHSILEIGIQNMSDVHLNPEVIGNAKYTDPQKLYIIGGLAMLVLLVAIINYITLSTSHTLKRMKEVGLRKTLGAFKSQIRIQLVIESFSLSILAGAIGVGLAFVITPYFSQLLDIPLSFTLDWISLVFIVFLALSIALISGGIQSFLIIKHKVVDAIKGTIVLRKDSLLNQSLLVLQFSLSIMLIIGTLVVRTQMNYIQNKDLGYDKERLIEISMQSPADISSANNLIDRLRLELAKDVRILEISGSMNSFRYPWTQLGFRQQDESVERVYFNKVEENYVKTMGIELVQGVDFDQNSENKSKILVNESLVNYFGWEDPLSGQIPGKNFTSSHQIIGVIKDFHFSTLHNKIEPLVLSVDKEAILEGVTGLSTYVWPINMYKIELRIGPGDLREIMDEVEAGWEVVNPNQPFVYSFVDDVLAKNYEEELRWQKVTDSASAFSIVIAWLGLIGLTRLSMQKREKEIGIRKVLGSTVTNITTLLSRKFLILIMIANIVAWPLAWILSERWLEDFTYRISLNPSLFLIGGAGVLLVALLSVGYQSLRAAMSNPVDSLKCE